MSAALTTDLDLAAAALRAGDALAVPTETVYGLAADAFQPRAVARVFEIKQRPSFDPLIVHIAEASQLADVAAEVPAIAPRLIARFWPGPLTLVLPRAPGVPDLVTSGLPTVAVRQPAHPLMRELIRRVGSPLAAPSANLFGRISPTTAQHVADQLGDRITWIVDGGPCRVGIESTVLDLTAARPRLLRPGGVTREELEAEVGPIDAFVGSYPVGDEAAQSAPAPGMLPQHYAPFTSLRIVSPERDEPGDAEAAAGVGAAHPRGATVNRRGRLAFQRAPEDGVYVAAEVLSPDGNLAEAAAGFFAALRRLDALGLDLIEAERFPDWGLGRALNDRLERAAQVRS